MHLLLARTGTVAEAGEAIDLGQSPADVVFLSAADTELAALLAAAHRLGPEAPPLRLANLMRLSHPMSVDTYIERTLRHARLVVVRVLGGAAYWPHGLEALLSLAQRSPVRIVALPGDDRPDPSLDRFCTLNPGERDRLWHYLVEGGAANADNFLRACRALLGETEWPPNARPLLKAGVLEQRAGSSSAHAEAAPLRPSGEKVDAKRPDEGSAASQGGTPVFSTRIPTSNPPLSAIAAEGHDNPANQSRPLAAVVFYRALVQSGQTQAIDALCDALTEAGLDPLPVYVTSLKDAVSAQTLRALFARRPPSIVVNLTGFAVSSPSGARTPTVLEENGAIVLQAVLSGGRQEAWETSTQGLSARDLAMNVALPEIDGRILSRAIAFKAPAAFDPLCEIELSAPRAVPDRVRFVADLAAAWARLAATPAPERRVAILLANYPNRDGRLGNGVGLDTPAGTIEVLRAMGEAGYDVGVPPSCGNALIDHLMAGPTNAGTHAREIRETLSLADYSAFFETLSPAVRAAITARWGEPESDPFFDRDRGFLLPLARFGHVMLGIQPARGYNIDPKETYHAPDLVPPHNYLALYGFLRRDFGAQAIVHMGKHGNLEWLPGKALALSRDCLPEAVLGPVPHLYPFIVNDPGEGTQAKRRASAVIVDHLTPPLTRAETYGPLRDLEALVDEYYAAMGGDIRRQALLSKEIMTLLETTGLGADAGISAAQDEAEALVRLDAYLCDLKEMQIRDGLHVFGVAPEGRLLTDLVVALARLPRGLEPAEDSLHRALARDLLGAEADPSSPCRDLLPAGAKGLALPLRSSSERPLIPVGRGQGEGEGTTPDRLALEPPPWPCGPPPHPPAGTFSPKGRRGAASAEDAPPSDAALPSSGRFASTFSPEGRRDAASAQGAPPGDAALPPSPLRGEGARRADEGDAAASPQPFDPLDCDMAAPWSGPRPQHLHTLSTDPWRSTGDTVERLELLAAGLVAGEIAPDPSWSSTALVLADIADTLMPSVKACGASEIAGLLTGLDGCFVAPGSSGAPTRGRPDVLPTGRNFFSVDTRAVPTPTAWTLGRKSAELLVLRHLQDQGEWPSSIGLTAWGTANMRTGGDDLAQALALIGTKPVWDMASRRVTGFEIITLAALGRPRVDVTLRISGFFRDAFPEQIALFDRAIRAVGALEEETDDNPIAVRMQAEAQALVTSGMARRDAERQAGFRIYGAMPGAYGAGLQALIDEKGWTDKADLAEAYLVWGAYAYGADTEGEADRAGLETRLAGVEAVVQNQDNREHDLLDSDDYYQFEGGMTAAVEHLSGRRPAIYHNDHSRPERPVVRTLEEEIARVVRARVVNPKWIAGVMRHGYKGAFEMAATVDYLFAFAATTGAVRDHHFDAVFDAYILDPDVRGFLMENNAPAFDEMRDRLGEAIERGLWSPRRNSARSLLETGRDDAPIVGRRRQIS